MSAREADSLLLRDPRVRSVFWRDLVPTCRLPTLAGRLDRAAPDLEHQEVY